MKAASPSIEEPSGGRAVRTARAVDRFWFAPADPTTLGLIRLCAGFLTLYVHLAYCLDLQEFFGKDAWSSLEHANLQRDHRMGSPWVFAPPGWTPPLPSIFLPPERDSRDAVLDYFADLCNGPKQERDKFLAFLGGQEVPDWGDNPPPAFLLNVGSVDPQARQLTVKFIEELPKDRAERTELLDYIREWSIDRRMTAHTGIYSFSIWFHVSDPAAMYFTQGLILLITLLFAVGFCTRITSVLTWLAAVSFLQRSPMTLFGGDTIMNILLFYLMIGPSGAALSVDRLIVRWLALRKARREGRPVPPWEPPQPSISANFVLRLMQIHFCFIYLASGTSKLLGGNWWNGQAIYYTMANYEFAPMRYAYYMATLRFLCHHRWLWELFMEGGSFFTVALEISLPFLVWNRRLRPFYVAASMLLHTMIALTMGLAVFSLLMATLVMAFIPGAKLQRFIVRLLRSRPLPPAPVAVEEELEPLPSRREKEKAGVAIPAKD